MSQPIAIAGELPFLRRYARALTGSQESGDAFVRATLEALLERGGMAENDVSPRVALYKAFHAVWSNLSPSQTDSSALDVGPSSPDRCLQVLPPHCREAMLLVYVEGFSASDAGEILGCSRGDVEQQLVQAQCAIEAQLTTQVLIIEDESVIALDLERIVEELGHQIAGVAATKDAAVRMAHSTQPGLVLADIRLADGSSGLDAANEIRRILDVPVIFITAYPERLLTGERPEPIYLITKPFMTETVMATIAQALFFHPSGQSLN